jgi:hypothetical protein
MLRREFSGQTEEDSEDFVFRYDSNRGVLGITRFDALPHVGETQAAALAI